MIEVGDEVVYGSVRYHVASRDVASSTAELAPLIDDGTRIHASLKFLRLAVEVDDEERCLAESKLMKAVRKAIRRGITPDRIESLVQLSIDETV